MKLTKDTLIEGSIIPKGTEVRIKESKYGPVIMDIASVDIQEIPEGYSIYIWFNDNSDLLLFVDKNFNILDMSEEYDGLALRFAKNASRDLAKTIFDYYGGVNVKDGIRQ